MLRPFPGKSLAKLQGNRGTVFVCCTGLDGISPVRCRFPLPAFFFTGLTGHQRYLIRYHKSGIKADAELSDQVLIHCIFRGAVLSSPISGGLFGLFRQLIRFGQPGQKFSGPGLGDSADIFDDFLFVHTYARICNGQGMFSASGVRRISNFSSPSNNSALVRDAKRNLSIASLALEISSRKKSHDWYRWNESSDLITAAFPLETQIFLFPQ